MMEINILGKKINPLTLRFSEKSLELDFHYSYVTKHIGTLRLAHYLAILFFVIAGVSDIVLIGTKEWLNYFRFVIIIPFFIFGLISTFLFTDFYKKYYQYFNLAYVLLTGISFIFSGVNAPQPFNYSLYSGLIVSLIFNYTFIKQDFIKASITGFLLLALFFIIAFINTQSTSYLVHILIYISTAHFLGMFIAYTIELDGRKSFLMMKEISRYSDEIKNINQSLELKVSKRTTELLQAKEKAVKSERAYKDVVETTSDLIMVIDSKGKILFINHASEKFFGLLPAKCIDRLFFDFVHDEDKEYTLNRFTEWINLEIKDTFYFENRLVNNEGKTRNAAWNIVVEYENNQVLKITSIVRDITAQKKAELELKKYQNNLEHLVKEKTEGLEVVNEKLRATNEELYGKNEIIDSQNTELKTALLNLQETQLQLVQAEKMASLGTLTAGVAHEINNPLNYIIGAYEGLKNYFSRNKNEEIEDVSILLNGIREGVDRASKIVRGLNQFSRDNNAYNEDCDIHAIIDNCIEMLDNQLKHKIEITKKYAKESFAIKGNVGNLHQVFLNVLTNARQSIENSGQIGIITELAENFMKISIVDTGIGISKENLPKLTDPFFTTKDPGKGTGLGLSISYNIIRKHGGKIEFESKLNEGTTVRILLPLQLNQN